MKIQNKRDLTFCLERKFKKMVQIQHGNIVYIHEIYNDKSYMLGKSVRVFGT